MAKSRQQADFALERNSNGEDIADQIVSYYSFHQRQMSLLLDRTWNKDCQCYRRPSKLCGILLHAFFCPLRLRSRKTCTADAYSAQNKAM
jgi:hypothetical protein